MSKEPKQVIVVRKDLHMRAGKMAAQCCHASMAAILKESKYVGDMLQISLNRDAALETWLNTRFTKICVYVNSEEELLALEKQAQEANIRYALITDCGLTEFNNVPTKTCIALGPDWPDNLDTITGNLPLL